jgi:hypothetical protein
VAAAGYPHRAHQARARIEEPRPSRKPAHYDGSQVSHQRAFALRESVGDLGAIGNSMTNLGMVAVLQKRYEEAREWFEKSMRLTRQVGDTWMVAVCHNNLGNATRGLGDYAAARSHYADSCAPTATTMTGGRSRSCWRISACLLH